MGFEWTIPPADALEEMGLTFMAQVRRAIAQLMESYAPRIENWMKENAPWTDRTGNARQSLWAETFDFIETIVLAYGHGVEYGQYLEFSHGGTYSIIGPATDHFLPQIQQDLQRIFS